MMDNAKSSLKNSAAYLSGELVKSFAKFLCENGLDSQTSLEVARQTVFGSAVMMKNSAAHPCELIDRVCSPGGTTIEGLLSLKQNGFEKTLIERGLNF